MSNLEYNYLSSTNSSLVNKILEQGQRLRNSMVQTIIKNDPFNREILSTTSLKSDENYNKNNYKVSNPTDKSLKVKNVSDKCQSDKKCLNEVDILNELGLNSEDSVLKPLKSKFNSCNCDICQDYNNISKNDKEIRHDIPLPKLDIPKSPPSVKQTKNPSIVTTMVNKNSVHDHSILKFVDSLKISVNTLKLNSAGKRKIVANSDRYTSENVTYFLEYKLPDILLRNVPKTISKVNSGLSRNKVCFCSKKTKSTVNNSVILKHEQIHLVSNMDLLDLHSINIEIRINYRTLKQKISVLFGKANFNLGVILTSPTLSVEQNLCILNGKVPVILGHLNICLQLGCDKLHFGKEFIDAVGFQRSNVNLSNVSVFKELDTDYSAIYSLQKPVTVKSEIHPNTERSSYFTGTKLSKDTPLDEEKVTDQLLYCFVNIPEAQLFTEVKNTYLICYGIHRDDIVTSRIVYDTNNPFYNFYQLVPLLYDDSFLGKLQEKSIVIEIWEKKANSEQLVGVTKLSLHRFYIIFRNSQLAALLFKNQNPTIAIDWFEPITHPVTKQTCGQLKALLALGTEAQINLLRQNIELKLLISQNTDRPKIQESPRISEEQKISYTPREIQIPNDDFGQIGSARSRNSQNIIVYDKYVQTPEIEVISTKKYLNCENFEKEKNKKIDASTQFNTMDSKIDTMEKMDSENQKCDSSNTLNSSLVDNFLVNSETQNQKNVYENCTNENLNSNLKSTTDLLDSLQKALSSTSTMDKRSEILENLEGFKAHITIDSALHLPSRKKCKSKKNKVKGGKHSEEILPSTYVTFKTDHNSDVIVTNVVPKNSNPKWDYRCDSVLPADLLLNNTKRLIFKVWRRANATTLQPNFQTDVVLGFAALDLTVLLSGLPNVQGWFNIVDFSSKCNGQIKIHVTPLENLSKYNKYKTVCTPEKPKLSPQSYENNENDVSPPELFNRALKRKFTELEEITQRLKQRLSKITNDDSDISDEFADEFERDLNTECEETEKISFENILKMDEAKSLNKNQDSDKKSKENPNKMTSFDDLFESITGQNVSKVDTYRLENSKITKSNPNQENLGSFDEILKNMTRNLSQNSTDTSQNVNDTEKISPLDNFFEKVAQSLSQNQNLGTSSQNKRNPENFSKTISSKQQKEAPKTLNLENQNNDTIEMKSPFEDILKNFAQKLAPNPNLTSTNPNLGSTNSCFVNPDSVAMNRNLGSVNQISSGTSHFGEHLSQEKSRIDTLLEKINSLTSSSPTEQKIDSLLEKLSIINDDSEKSFSNRYVSGCSLNQEIQPESSPQIFKNLGNSNNIDTDLIFNPMLFQKIFSEGNTPRSEELNIHSLKSLISSNSSTSMDSFSETNTPRGAPEGGANNDNK